MNEFDLSRIGPETIREVLAIENVFTDKLTGKRFKASYFEMMFLAVFKKAANGDMEAYDAPLIAMYLGKIETLLKSRNCSLNYADFSDEYWVSLYRKVQIDIKDAATYHSLK